MEQLDLIVARRLQIESNYASIAGEEDFELSMIEPPRTQIMSDNNLRNQEINEVKQVEGYYPEPFEMPEGVFLDSEIQLQNARNAIPEFIPPIRNLEVPPAPTTRFGNFFTASRISMVFNVTFAAITIAVIIYEAVIYFEDQDEQKKMQAKLYEEENNYEQKFQAKLFDLNSTSIYKRQYHAEHYEQGLFNYSTTLPEPTEIKAYWRYGEVGQDYLDFRIKYPCEFPSIADGLSKIEELWHLISPGYMRIRPYIKIGEVNNTWKNWSQAIQYGYIPYANRKKDKNFKEFNEKYHAFLMQHGSQRDLNLNTFQNAVPKYWSDQLLHNEAGHISDYVKPIIANVELLLPLFMALFTFEDSLSDHTTDHKFLPATSSLPTNVESTWSIYKRNVMPLPMPELPIIKLYWNAKANFGSVSGGKSRDLNIVYSIPKLSLIVLANEKSITLLTPGDQSVIYGVKCNAVWMQYLFVNDSQTLIFEKNVSYTFKNNQLLYSQVKTTLFFPIIKKMESARPNQTFVQVPLPLEIKENISQAYLIALNNKSIDRALQTLTGTPILHQEWEKNQTDYNSQENFKYGTWVVAL